MSDVAIKLFIMSVCSGLFWYGGFKWHNCRRFIMPLILAGTAFWITRDVWSLAMLSVIGIFCLGYGERSPLRHSLGDGWGRGTWGALAAICLSLPLFLTHHLGLPGGFLFLGQQSVSVIVCGIYVTLNFILENALKKIPQSIGDPIIGASFASIIFLI